LPGKAPPLPRHVETELRDDVIHLRKIEALAKREVARMCRSQDWLIHERSIAAKLITKLPTLPDLIQRTCPQMERRGRHAGGNPDPNDIVAVRDYRDAAEEATVLLHLSHIGQIALPVSDVDRAEKFYETVIGLRKLYRFGDLTFFDCAGVRLLLGGSPPRQGGVIYFRCADISLTAAELKRRGVVFTHPPHLIARMDDHDPWMAFFDDPEGHTLAVMQEAPKGYAPPAS
jgi:methylmalonyl-CoA/ethylmalonyl-CoA epimerase